MKNTVAGAGIVLFIGCFLECFVFNFAYIRTKLDFSKEYNISYSLSDMEKVNWRDKDGKLIAGVDQQLILEGLNLEIDKIAISFSAVGELSTMLVYYTNDELPYFNGDLLIQSTDVGSGSTEVTIGEYVKDLRIDPGESVGMELKDFKIVINPAEFRFSRARLVAILLIWLVTRTLFVLQAPNDFRLDDE